MKIMICEGDEVKAKVLTGLLNVYKYKLITLTKSGDFFRQVQTHKPAVIILNESFYHKSGQDFINRLRTDPVSSRTPVIIIQNENGTGENNIPLEFNADGLTEMLKEPLKIKYLRHCVDRWTTFRSLHIKQ